MEENNLEQDENILDENQPKPVDSVDEDEDEDDIEFDDNIDIEALTQQLQQHVDIGDVSNLSNEDFNNSTDIQVAPPTDADLQLSASVNNDIQPVSQNNKKASVFDEFPKSECKKYVIYITPNNIDYVDSLSIDDRTELINNVIYESHNSDVKNKQLKERQKYLKHLIVVCITVIISFPILFFAVNKSLQASISNYQQSQQNFQKLYKEKGKITTYQKMDLQD